MFPVHTCSVNIVRGPETILGKELDRFTFRFIWRANIYMRITSNIMKRKSGQVETGQGEVATCSFKAKNTEIRSL